MNRFSIFADSFTDSIIVAQDSVHFIQRVLIDTKTGECFRLDDLTKDEFKEESADFVKLM